MRFKIENIGKVRKADIEIDGITVIGGNNDTGKSTIGRALYTVFDSFYHVSEKIKKDRTLSICRILESMLESPDLFGARSFASLELFAESLLADSEKYLNDKNALKDVIHHAIRQFEEEARDPYPQDSYLAENNSAVSDIDSMTERIQSILALSDEDFIKRILQKGLEQEFLGQINNFVSDEPATMSLTVKNKNVDMHIENDSVRNIDNSEAFTFRIAPVYIDDPLVIDRLSRGYYEYLDPASRRFKRVFSSYSRERQLVNKLMRKEGMETVSSELLVRDKFADIFGKVSDISHCSFIENTNHGRSLRMDGSDRVLELRNISAGIKSFLILKQLIDNGSLETKGLIIIDEPEIHLHPDWQLLYAELIVLMQKEFDLHVLINTHSPYFLRALEVYSAKHSIADRCRYYLSDLDEEGSAVFTDCTGHVNDIYEKLAEPLNRLVDLKAEIEYER